MKTYDRCTIQSTHNITTTQAMSQWYIKTEHSNVLSKLHA